MALKIKTPANAKAPSAAGTRTANLMIFLLITFSVRIDFEEF
jgi:hypothetical protein